MSQTAMLLASGKKGGNVEATPSKKKKKMKKKKKGEQPQWYGVAKGLKTGAWYDTYSAIKPLVHGVKPALYEGFPTEVEAWDFVENHRDHHEGAKQKSARKAHNAEWEAREAAREASATEVAAVATPNPKEKLEFAATPGGGVATPGPHSESNTEDRDFIKDSDESESEPHTKDDDDNYQPGDSEFEESDDDDQDSEEAVTAAVIKKAADAAIKEIARQHDEALKVQKKKEERDLQRVKQNHLEEVM